jgi:hypothetical protein
LLHLAAGSGAYISLFQVSNICTVIVKFGAQGIEAQPMALFSSRLWAPDSASAATVFLSEHCSSFCFLVQKIVQKNIN